MDTRHADGPDGGPSLAGGATRRFDFAGKCGIPTPAVALSLNIAVAAPSAGGYLTVYSPDLADRPATSTLNLQAGTTRANNSVQALSSDGLGGVKVFLSGGRADLVIDVNGYFAPEEGLPPDPAAIAPPSNPTVTADPYTDTQFLYTNDPPVQTDVAPGTIDPERVAILVGAVVQSSGAPLSGVRITVLRHPEFGFTRSRADGKFDLVVNGGGALALRYEKAGFLTAERQIDTPWRDYVAVPGVTLLRYDGKATLVQAGSPQTQIARGTAQTDADGARTPTLFFLSGTAAQMVLPDGTSQPLSAFHVRATEFTVGANGPAQMPGPLPPSAEYTYAVDLSVDEAVTAGATAVTFNQPVANYIENFLGFPVGFEIPAAWFNEAQAIWVPLGNGRVLGVLGDDGQGLALLDLDGSGQPAGDEALLALGITAEERRALLTIYAPGQTLWRVALRHFTKLDYNFPPNPPPDAEAPPDPEPDDPDPDHDPNWDPQADPDHECGSIIECQNQVLGEELPLAGTPFRLTYRSDRVSGHTSSYTLKVRVTGAAVPASLRRAEVTVTVAGRTFSAVFPPAPNQSYTFRWDGLGPWGNPVYGQVAVRVETRFYYPTYYGKLPLGEVWAGWPEDTIPLAYDRSVETVLARSATWPLARLAAPALGAWQAKGLGFGGWSLSAHHVFDPGGRVLYLGDGRRVSAEALGLQIRRAAGGGTDEGDGGPARLAMLNFPTGFAFLPDGTLLIADREQHRVRRVGTDGVISTVAGDGTPCPPDPDGGTPVPCGDGGAATDAQLVYPWSVAPTPDGGFLIADSGNRCIRKVSAAGVISTVAGACLGIQGQGGQIAPRPAGRLACEGCAATEASLGQPTVVLASASGGFYIGDGARVLRVLPDGTIHSAAGQDGTGDLGDGGPAGLATLRQVSGLSEGPNGSLYISDSADHRVRKVSRAGLITTVAGTGAAGFGGDGGPAIAAALNYPAGISLGADGSLYIADRDNFVVRRVTPEGTIVTAAGTHAPGGGIEGSAPASFGLGLPLDVGFSPGGDLFLSDDSAVYRAGRGLQGFKPGETILPDPSGQPLYVFDSRGRHLRTVHALTGATLLSFSYDAHGLLAAVTDGDGDVTTIGRDGRGEATAVVGPFGQRTALSYDSNGYLAASTNPAGETVRLEHSPFGLLTRLTDARGLDHLFTYDALGNLFKDADPAGGSKTLVKRGSRTSYTVDLSTALSVFPTSYSVQKQKDGGTLLAKTAPDSGTVTESLSAAGDHFVHLPDGATWLRQTAGDPRWGPAVPRDQFVAFTVPGGLTHLEAHQADTELSNPDDPLSVLSDLASVTFDGVHSFTRRFNAADRTFTFTSATGRQLTEAIDAQGRIVSRVLGDLESERIAYDSHGRIASISQGTGAAQRTLGIGYRTDGSLGSLTDPLQRTTTFDYDAAGRITAQTLPDGRVITFTSDGNGNLTSVTPPSRPRHAMTFTPVDLQASYDPPLLGAGPVSTTYSYDLDHHLTGIQRPDGKTVTLAYDLNRLISLTFSRGRITFAYDPVAFHLKTVTTPDGETLTEQTDGPLPIQTTWSGPVAGSVERTFEPDFLLPSVETVNGADPVSFTYDADGLLIQAGGLTLTRSPRTGLLTDTALAGVATNQSYNPFGDLASFSSVYNTTPLLSAQLTRDAAGRIQEKEETIAGSTDTYGYTYDSAGRLTDVTKNGAALSHYDYDSNGNRTQATTTQGATTATYDAQDRLLQYGDTAYTYTANGELTARTQGGRSDTYDYDELGNLRAVGLATGVHIDYVIDGANRRVGKKVNGTLVKGFLWSSSLRIAAELDGTGAIVSRFIYGTRANVPDTMVRGGITYRLIADPLGSPRLVVSTIDGTIAQRMDYDEFGQVILDTNPGFQPFGFAGGLYDPQTGLVRFGARDYDGRVGRWTAKDPIGFEGGDPNLYDYSLLDPVNLFDPTGLENLSYEEIISIVFNETRSLDGDNIQEARINIAHAVMNGTRLPRRPKSAPKVARVPPQEQQAWNSCVAAVNDALDQFDFGVDPTGGASWYNFRNSKSGSPFYGHPLKTQVGPLDNSYARGGLRGAGVYANTYGDN